MNNNSIMSLVLYRLFPLVSLILYHKGPQTVGRKVFPWYHRRDYSSTGGKMKQINKEKIEFIQPLQ